MAPIVEWHVVLTYCDGALVAILAMACVHLAGLSSVGLLRRDGCAS